MKLGGVMAFLMAASITYGADSLIDYSQIERKNVEEKNRWKVEDIYISENEWEKDKNTVIEMMKKIESMKKKVDL